MHVLKCSVVTPVPLDPPEHPLSFDEIKRIEGIYQPANPSPGTYLVVVKHSKGDTCTLYYNENSGSLAPANTLAWSKVRFKMLKDKKLCMEIK